MLKQTVVGVDIGEHTVKCVVMGKIKNDYFIKEKKSYPYKSLKDVKSILVDFIKTFQIRRPVFNISLPYLSSKVTARLFDMPAISMKEIRKSIPYEIEEKVLLLQSMNDIYYCWDIAEKTDAEYRIIAATIQKNILAEIQEFKHPGWVIKYVEPQFVSISRSIGNNDAVIDLGHISTRVMVYKGGKPLYVQSIDTGGASFTESIISHKFESSSMEPISLAEAEQIKHIKAATLIGHMEIENDPEVKETSKLIAEQVKSLSNEIKQNMRSVEIRENFTIENVYFTGNTARLSYLVDYLSNELGCDLIPLNLTGEGFDEDYDYAIASSTWLRSEVNCLKNINFIHSKRNLKINKEKTALFLIVSLLLTQGMLYGFNLKAEALLEEADAELSQYSSEVSSIYSQMDDYRATIDRYYQIQQAHDQITGNDHSSSVALIDEITNKTPQGIVIESMDINKSRSLIEGTYKDYTTLNHFVALLREIANIEATEEEVDKGDHKFSIPITKAKGDKS